TPRSDGLIGEASTATTTSLPPGSGTSLSTNSSRSSPLEEIVERRLRPRLGVARSDDINSLSSRGPQPIEQAPRDTLRADPRPTNDYRLPSVRRRSRLVSFGIVGRARQSLA